MILHHGTTFAVGKDGGDIETEGELGLYFEDIRVLSQHLLRLDGKKPLLLTSKSQHASAAIHFLTNPALDGAPRGTLGIVRRQSLDRSFRESVEIDNFGDHPAHFSLSFCDDADFLHVFQVKLVVEQPNLAHDPNLVQKKFHRIDGENVDRLHVDVEGGVRETVRRFGSAASFAGNEARFRIELKPKERRIINLEIDFGGRAEESMHGHHAPKKEPRLVSDRSTLVRAYRQSAKDIDSLRLSLTTPKGETKKAIAAGIPWFMALFGRDSLIASYQSIFHDPTLAKSTLELLADLQGTKVDPIAVEAPGKILHEYRYEVPSGPQKLIPRFPYYGSIDATPLFLITLSEYVRTSGDLALAKSLYGNVQRAVTWMTSFGDRDGDGFLEYFNDTGEGLKNQGWKDSGDSIRFKDGTIAEGAIALVEVQGYAIDALRRSAELATHLGEKADAKRFLDRAELLHAALESQFWMEDRGYYALALDGHKKKVDAITSNPGHLLWCNVVSKERLQKVADVLVSDVMASGYGVRTMATTEGGYNPISYHNGSVWPHDSSLVVAGLARAGCRDHAAKIASEMLAALDSYGDDRLPELFAGYAASVYGTPVEYPSANRPQAWASGAVMLLVRSMLGLEVDALEKRVSVRPFLPASCDHLEVYDVPIGSERADVRVVRKGGAVDAEITNLPSGWKRDA